MNPQAVSVAIVVLGLALASPGCSKSGWGDRAPFDATAPSATTAATTAGPPPDAAPSAAPIADGSDGSDGYAAPEPETSAPPPDASGQAAPEPRPADHIWGKSSWPCTGAPACAEASPADGTLGINVASFESLDPSTMADSEGELIDLNLFEGLVAPARRSGLPYEQGVAERWSLSEDQRTWTFHLRADARWSNGRAVTAQDFVFAWRRKLDPKTASRAVDTLFFIAGAEEFNRGTLKDPEQIGVRAIDDRTLAVTLTCAIPFWPTYLASAHYLPVPREVVEKWGADWTKPEHIVTNGPYTLTEWKERDRLVLQRSDTYWDRAQVQIPRVVLYQGEGEEKPKNLFKTSQTQWARMVVAPQEIPDYIASGSVEFVLDPVLCIYMYMFRTDRPPFDDARVRRAFDAALDKDRLVKHIARGFQTPADGAVPPLFDTTIGYPGKPGQAFDKTAAQRMLSEAGYPNGAGFPEFKITYNTLDWHKSIATFAAEQFKENLGAHATLENVEWKSLLKKVQTGDFQMARYGWCGADAPYTFLEFFQSQNPQNAMGYKNAEYDALLAKAKCAGSQRESLAAMAEAEAIVQRDMPAIPVYYNTRPYLKKPVLQGLETHSEDAHPFKYMYWADKQTAPTPHAMPAIEGAK